MKYIIGVDVGGTHTDLVSVSGGKLKVAKVPTTPDDLFIGMRHGLEMLAEANGVTIKELISNTERFVHASTTATNMFVGHRIPKVGFLATKGHRDSLWLRDGYKPDRWNLRMPPLWEMVPRYMRRTAEGRFNYRGEEIIPLNEDDVYKAAQFFKKEEVKAVAICFLWSFVDPSHERKAKEIVAGELPGVPVLISSDTLPTIREWERSFGTALSVGILAEVEIYLRALEAYLREMGFKRDALIMRCDGGFATIARLLRKPLFMVASGPAAGGLAGVFYGARSKFTDVMTIDEGGTSFDVCLLPRNQLPITVSKRLENEPIAVPSVDIHTIGAGGGSIAWIDKGGALQVGPQSAGAVPGPVCYGKGGEEPTVTDAYLLLGMVSSDCFLGGRFNVYPDLAKKAIDEKIAKPLGLDVYKAAADIVRIINSKISDAMRLVSVQRGIDPRPFTLLVGGGAGPVHAVDLAKMLGMKCILVPREAGGFCALGMISGDLIYEPTIAFPRAASRVEPSEMEDVYQRMEEESLRELHAEGIPKEKITLQRFADARYIGQVYEVPSPVKAGVLRQREDIKEIERSFEDEHERLYHYRISGYPIEFISCRVRAEGKSEPLVMEVLPYDGPDASVAIKGKRRVYSLERGDFVEANIYDVNKLKYGNTIRGEAIVETEGSTLGIWGNAQLIVDKYGDFEITIPLR